MIISIASNPSCKQRRIPCWMLPSKLYTKKGQNMELNNRVISCLATNVFNIRSPISSPT